MCQGAQIVPALVIGVNRGEQTRNSLRIPAQIPGRAPEPSFSSCRISSAPDYCFSKRVTDDWITH